jgi:hypothetical protein
VGSIHDLYEVGMALRKARGAWSKWAHRLKGSHISISAAKIEIEMHGKKRKDGLMRGDRLG